jgi:hypothetical protein
LDFVPFPVQVGFGVGVGDDEGCAGRRNIRNLEGYIFYLDLLLGLGGLGRLSTASGEDEKGEEEYNEFFHTSFSFIVWMEAL